MLISIFVLKGCSAHDYHWIKMHCSVFHYPKTIWIPLDMNNKVHIHSDKIQNANLCIHFYYFIFVIMFD